MNDLHTIGGVLQGRGEVPTPEKPNLTAGNLAPSEKTVSIFSLSNHPINNPLEFNFPPPSFLL